MAEFSKQPSYKEGERNTVHFFTHLYTLHTVHVIFLYRQVMCCVRNRPSQGLAWSTKIK